MEADYDNVRRALTWMLEHQEVTMAAQLASALCPFWEQRGYLDEGRQWLERCMSRASSLSPVVQGKGAANIRSPRHVSRRL